MKTTIAAAAIIGMVFFAGSQMISSNKNSQLAQVAGSIKTDVISVDAPATVAQGQTITFSVRTVVATNRVYGYLHDQVNDGRNSTDVLAIPPLSGPVTTNGTYSVTIPMTVPLGQYRLTIYGDEFGGYVPAYDTVTVIAGVPDTVPPVISAVSAGSIGTSTAIITWTTNEPSDSAVFLPRYVSTSTVPVSGTAPTSHRVVLTGLASDTEFEYRVSSRDAAGNIRTSSYFRFATVRESVLANIKYPGIKVIWKNGEGQTVNWLHTNARYQPAPNWALFKRYPVTVYLAGGSLASPLKLKDDDSSIGNGEQAGIADITVPSATVAPAGSNYYILVKDKGTGLEAGRSGLFAIAANPAPVTITSISSGANLKKGLVYPITLSSIRSNPARPYSIKATLVGGGLPSSGLNIDYYDSNRFSASIGSVNWHIGKYTPIPVGSNYRIKIERARTVDGNGLPVRRDLVDWSTVTLSAPFNVTN